MTGGSGNDDQDAVSAYRGAPSLAELPGILWDQFMVMTRKNLLSASRRWPGTLATLMIPVLFFVALGLLRLSVGEGVVAEREMLRPMVDLPDCDEYPHVTAQCYSLVYTNVGGGNSLARQLMQTLAQNHDPPLNWGMVNATSNADIGELPSSVTSDDEVAVWLDENRNVTYGVLQLQSGNFLAASSPIWILWHNDTITPDVMSPPSQGQAENYYYSIVYHFYRAALTIDSGGSPAQADVRYRYAPVATDTGAAIARTLFEANLGPMAAVIGACYLMGVIGTEVGQERQSKLWQGLYVMGMKNGVYLFSWWFYYGLFAVINTFSMIAVGNLFGISWIANVDLDVLIAVFMVSSLAAIGMGMMFTVVTRSLTGVNNISISLMVIAFAMVVVDFISLTGMMILYDPTSAGFNTFAQVSYFFPHLNLVRMLDDIKVSATPSFGVFGGFGGESVDGFSWSNMKDQRQLLKLNGEFVTIPTTTLDVLSYQLYQAIAYPIIAWYLQNVVPGDFAAAQVPWFFLIPPLGMQKRLGYSDVKLERPYDIPNSDDPDIKAEIEAVYKYQGTPDADDTVLRIANLSKTYSPLLGTKKLAVRNMHLSAKKNSILAILGHNGAGKTTLINMLIGLVSVTKGNATIFNKSVRTSISHVQERLGLCPQFDVLWPALTAREHLEMFARLKRVKQWRIKDMVDKTLEEVRLTHVQHQFVGSFSGGMKRRVSVAISTLGDPEIILLDEPTSGLDPLNKRHTWDLIQLSKRNRLVVLTTHSMAEADALADKVVVMADGFLKAVGTPLHLKQRFGQGYNINIVTDPANSGRVQRMVVSKIPGAQLRAESAGNLSFSVPADLETVSQFMQFLEKGGSPMISDWGVSHTSLEEVFLSITHGSEFAYAASIAKQQAVADMAVGPSKKL